MKSFSPFQMKFLLCLLIYFGAENLAESANILAVLPYPLYSHYASFMEVFKELAARGHNVTIVSPFPQKTPVPNLTEIVVPVTLRNERVKSVAPKDELEAGTLWYQMFGFSDISVEMARSALSTEQLRKLIKDESSKFDLVLSETGNMHEPFVAFAYKFNAPFISLVSKFFLPKSAYISGNDMPTSYAPLTVYFGFNDRMTFMERVQNFFFYYLDVFYANYYYYRKQDALIREYFKYPGSEDMPSLDVMLRNTALTLMEHDFAVGYPVPLHRNVILLTGVSIKHAEPLPSEYQKLMDENIEGVIYFSMGSLFRMSSWKSSIKRAIISALNRANLTVLMKYNDVSLAEKLTNKKIIVKPWFPQRAILAHPNCKLFITHGGIHGTMEGFYHGVPMIAIPLASDQRYNARIIETHGVGISLDVYKITSSQLLKTINEVMTNLSYRENAQKRSSIFKDHSMDIMDNAIYWIEYVIRHKGAPHLRPAVLDLYWYQRLMLDVIAFYLFIVVFTIFIIKNIIFLLFRYFKKKICQKIKKE